MANYDSAPHADVPIPYKIIEETNSHLIDEPTKEHDTLIASLPLQPSLERTITFAGHTRLYKDVWMRENIIRGILVMQQCLKTRPTDIFLASFPKSGTTWLKAMIFATLTRTNRSIDQHPLHTHNPHQCVMFMDVGFATGRSQIIENIPSPRVMSTHLPYFLLPDSITESNCRIVYVWRDPKDVLVSMWYFVQKILGGADKIATFDQYYKNFYEGLNSYGPIWNHVLGYWEESKRRPEKILFLKYENILQEPVKCAKQLAHFLGRPYSEAEENQGVVEQIVELCSIKTLKNLDVNKDGNHATSTAPNVHISHAYYFRKGETGDWKSHMTQEMAERFDTMIEEKFKGSGLHI
ncbi:Sulfotransferase [Rhynchospora pubera]|uniref:Sulfotransferase n=1 Tax=Rhynchospora pubera TaxID=906938 RepID=A0AAV8G490_9POAL|nr:Sulfotransferase [Rhynchospora pubera]